MEKFINQLANFIHEKEYELQNLTIVFPSQRAKKYLQRALFEVYKRPVFSPQITTMDRWIKDCSLKSIIDPTRGLFQLYNIHKKKNPEGNQGFDEFLQWGKTLINDFDEIDRYLIDSKDLFRNLADIKEIENWSFNNEELTQAQKRFMEFWDLLPGYYKAYNELLEKENSCYMGGAYKEVATNLDLVFRANKETRFIFAGFNALSPAETSIIKQLHRMGRAELFIDADSFYLNDENHEAGYFIRKLLKELDISKPDFVRTNLISDEKEIEVINCAQSTGQAKVSATILAEQIPSNEFSETVLLLADEKLAVPVIKNIPLNVGQSNITLGLPLKYTAIRSWVDLLFRVQESFQQFRTKSIYHKDFIRFIKHPLIIAVSSEEERIEWTKIESKILDKNWLFISAKKLECSERLKELITLFFTPWNENANDAIRHIRKLNQVIFQEIKQEKFAIEKSILFHFDSALSRLENVLLEFAPSLFLKTFKTLFNQHWINESIAYYGNPLEGLQVMGLLETRLLDFKNIIVVGLNDGKMPPGNPIQTLIPMDLRRFHALPTPRDKQGLFAHHFYRLLHTAEKVWITYSSAEGGTGVEEPSRYILQLKLELARQNKAIQWREKFYTLTDDQQDNSEIKVEKTPAIIERLDEYFERKTSASALRTYLNCPLDFYFKYILGFGEEDQVEEEIEANTLGNFIHKTLEILYRPYAKQDENQEVVNENPSPIHGLVLENMQQLMPGVLKEQFESYYAYNKEVLLSGKNYLSYEVATHLTQRFLQTESTQLKREKANVYIESLEAVFERTLVVSIDGEDKKINFKGYIDRIDRFNGELRLLDYKSGKCATDQVTITDMKRSNAENESEHLLNQLKKKPYVFQLLLYNYLYFGKYKRYPEKTGIISMVNVQDGPFFLVNKLTANVPELMELFESVLEELIREIYDPTIFFEHNPTARFCMYCD